MGRLLLETGDALLLETGGPPSGGLLALVDLPLDDGIVSGLAQGNAAPDNYAYA